MKKYIVLVVFIFFAAKANCQSLYYKDLLGRWFITSINNSIGTYYFQDFLDSNTKTVKSIFHLPSHEYKGTGKFCLSNYENETILNFDNNAKYFVRKIDSNTLWLQMARINSEGNINSKWQNNNKAIILNYKRETAQEDSVYKIDPYVPPL